ncbi:MAG: ATP-binding protein [Ignavibacteriota bacterium]
MLRIRLVLWYSLLVVLTVAAVALVQYLLLYRLLASDLDSDLLEDAKSTLHLLGNRSSTHPGSVSPRRYGAPSTRSVKDIIDEVIRESPDNISGEALTDRVLNALMDEMLGELSGKDSTATDPFDALIQRTLTSRRNDYIEIYSIKGDSGAKSLGVSLFRTQNLGSDTIKNLFNISLISPGDTNRNLGEVPWKSEILRAAIASNKKFMVFAAYTEADIWDTVSRSQKTYLFVLPIALLIATLGGIVLARKALKPIEEIARTARDIGAKNLSRRIEMPARGDKEMTSLVSTLNSMISRLEESFTQIAQFSSDASHELKTPLSIMKGEIEQTQRKLENVTEIPKTETRALLASMMEEVERMQRIVEGLLLLAKADDHRLPLSLKMISPTEFLGSIAEDVEILASDRGLRFVRAFEKDMGDVLINADPTLLYQVLMNLIDNAFKYTPNGGTVRLLLERNANSVIIGVEDTGPGIAEADLTRIFLRFYRTEQARAHEGSEHTARSLGLGLAITKSIIEAHAGTIEVESILGVGSKFIVTLPISAA